MNLIMKIIMNIIMNILGRGILHNPDLRGWHDPEEPGRDPEAAREGIDFQVRRNKV